jgi:hypothetical protein
MWVKSIKQLKRREVGLVVGAIAVCASGTWAIVQALHPTGPTVTPSALVNLGQLPLPEAAFPAQKTAAVLPDQQLSAGLSGAGLSGGASGEGNTKSATVAQASGQSGVGINRQGLLRISNLSDAPVRVALLPQKPSSAALPAYEPPAHWDFDPEEGQVKGLVVGLPNRPSLKVKPGEVLVAFALDGSRRYWGPYVVGETEFPRWEPKGAEWLLVLPP